MKRIITLLALIATASAAHAQTDSLVVFDTQGDNIEISIAGFDITLSDDDKDEKPKVKRVTTNFISISLGYKYLQATFTRLLIVAICFLHPFVASSNLPH